MSFGRRVATIVVLVACGLAPVTLAREPGRAETNSTPIASSPDWWDDAVCYEVFVRSFFDSDGDGIGDLNGLTAKLDYLNDGDAVTTDDLGVTCLWLMPLFESPS